DGQHRTIDGIAIRPDGAMVAAVSQYGAVEAWRVADGRSSFRHDEPASRFQAAAFSPDGHLLAVAGQDAARGPDGEPLPYEADADARCLVVVLDLERGTTRWRTVGTTTGIIRGLAFSPDGQTLASADNATTVTLFEVRTGNIRRVLRGHRRLVSHLAYSS